MVDNSKKKLKAPVDKRTFGEKAADKIADFGGSWKFIGIFACVLVVWITLNAFLMTKPYDPFPFILLNLLLSCLAAIQAPIIMMSQNRQEDRDRQRAELDLDTNLEAMKEITKLHLKIDELMEYVEEIVEKKQAN